MALTQVAINLCQLNSFKEVALNLEKPTYGRFLYDVPFPEPTYFVIDPEALSRWARVEDHERLCEEFREPAEEEHLARWHAAVEEQCLKLTKEMPLPNPLKQRIRPWIKRIALEYLTYCRRQEVLFEVSRYFLMDVLSVRDWQLDGRIDEEKMDQEQQLAFFNEAFEMKIRCTRFLLHWPHQDYFLPMINQLWGIIPKDENDRCLTDLVQKYSGSDGKESCDYEYRSLLGALWEVTPNEYKNYVLCRKTKHLTLLSQLLRSPFLEKDQVLFKQIFRDQPQEKRREMMLTDNEGEFMCSRLIREEKWTFLNWLLKECLSQEEIVGFRKRFIPSFSGSWLCMDLFEEDRQTLVEAIFSWCLGSDAEEKQYKDDFISGEECEYRCASLLSKGNIAAVERVINFCLSSVEEKGRVKSHFAQGACGFLLNSYASDSWLEDDMKMCEESVWEQMDTVIAWNVDAEEKINEFKKNLLSRTGIAIHYKLVFVRRIREKTERFYQWFGLSPKEIKQLKWGTLLTDKALVDIAEELDSNEGLLLSPLRWCLTDEETVINFKKDVKVCLFFLSRKGELDELLSKVLEDIPKEIHNDTNTAGVFVKDEERKRSVAVDDEPNFPEKRPRQI
ncbi:uncharacterized protein LOC129232874 [Uloborus diversus]|uniref:uncharacterized protein LOC129232874 n=1 Tax=Uloborus diversus TaxID=327109 RepID=UPI00240A1BC2|nr:uncharacterized protein LOC129232874 [Uloborus diversus]